jgi:hypothetical protein
MVHITSNNLYPHLEEIKRSSSRRDDRVYIPLNIPCPKVYANKPPNASAMDNTQPRPRLSVQQQPARTG